MIKKVYRWLSLVVLLLSQFTGLINVSVAANDDTNNRYIGWTTTTGTSPDTFDESIYVSPKGSEPGKFEAAIVAYCFNYTYATPPKPQEGESEYPIYVKETGTKDNFESYATSEKVGGEELYNAILKVMYNGYPNNAASLQGTMSDARFRAVTQYAVWYYTDSFDSAGSLKGKELELYNILIGNHAGAKAVPDNAILDIYRNTKEVPSPIASKPEYQNLLSSQFVDKETGKKIEIIPSVDIYAKKVWEGVDVNEAKVAVKFQLTKNGKAIEDPKEVITPAGKNESEVVKWGNLPGNYSDYRVEEVDVPAGFTSSKVGTGVGTEKEPFVVTNTKKSEVPAYVQSITVTKKWEGDAADTSKRPEVYFTIFQVKDGKETMLTKEQLPSKTLENPKKLISPSASVRWTGLYAPGIEEGTGKSIRYIVKETDQLGNPLVSPYYDVKSTVVGETGFNHAYTFTNTFKKEDKKDVVISKVKLGGEELPGAEITILKDGAKVDSWKSTTTPKELKLTAGEYVFREDAAPAGYEKVTDITFTVEADGTVKVKDAAGNTVEASGKKLTVTDKETAKEVIISKVDIAGKEVEGARIEIYNEHNNIADNLLNGHNRAEWTSKKDDVFKLKLAPGTYTFKETVAPEGLQKVTELKFKIDEQGKVSIVSKGVNDDKTEARVVVESDNKLIVTDMPETKDVIISKVKLGGEELPGAKIKIFKDSKKDSKEVASWESTDKPHELKLAVGEYVFHEEVAPNGYLKVTDIKFTVDAKGHVKVIEDTKTAHKSTTDGNKLTVVDELIAYNVSINKVDIAGEEVEGAYIKIYNNVGIADNLVKGHDPAEWRSKKGEEFKLKLIPGTYTFKEETAPKGLQKVTELKFKIDEQGKVSIVSKGVNDDKTAAISELKDGNKLIVTDKPEAKDVVFSKVNLGGKEIAGAQIEIRQGEQKVEEWTSEADKSHTVKLSAGDYIFHEEVAPNGYLKVTDIKFTVDAEGNVTVTEDTTTVHKSTTAGNKLTVVDEAEPLVEVKKDVIISKVNLGGEELEGAEIEISKDGKVVEKWTSEKTAKTIKLEAGDYIFVENAAPAGYEKVSEIHFTVNAEGKVVVTKVGDVVDQAIMSNTAKVDTSNENKLIVIDQAKQHDIEISKQNLGGEELENAEIEIFKATEKGEKELRIAKWTSTKESHKFTLEAGNYIFVENAAPAGYEKVTDIHFTVTVDGKVNVTKVGDSTKQDDMSKTAKVDAEKANKLIVIDQATKHDVVISKVNLGGEEIAGAQIEIRQGNQKVEEWTSEAGKSHTVKLVAGDYIFHEKAAPNGYLKVTDITFTVSEDGKVTVKDAAGNKVEATASKLVVTDQDAPTTETSTTASETTTEATTTSTTVSEVSTEATTTSTTVSETTTEATTTSTTVSEATTEATITSTTVSEATTEATTTSTTVSEATTEATTTNTTVSETTTEASTTAPAVKKDVVISKVNLGGEELEGAEIEISKDGKVVEKWTSEKTAKTIKLEAGDYIFHEKAAPNGYLKVTDITFTVSEDGKVTVKEAAGNKVEATNNKLIVTDQAAPTTETTTESTTSNTTEKVERGDKGEKTKVGSKKSKTILPRTGEQVVLWMSVAGSILLVALAAFMYLKIKNHNL